MTEVATVMGTHLADVVGHTRDGAAYCKECAESDSDIDTEKPDRELAAGGVVFRESEGEFVCDSCHKYLDTSAPGLPDRY